jgi:hypothetical protein
VPIRRHVTVLPAAGSARVWRPSVFYRLFFGIVGVGMVVVALLPWDDAAGFTQDLLIRLVALLGGMMWLALTSRARMELRDGELVLRYTFTTRTIPLHTLVSVTPGREGLTFETADGARHGSPAFIGEKAPLSAWMKRRTRADSIADVIMAARPGA